MVSKSRTSCAWAMFAALTVGCLGAGLQEAQAQASGCQELQTYLLERKSIAERLQAGPKKQMDAKVACTGFNQLVANGDKLVKWTTTNKDWCQVPDSFIASIKDDHAKAQTIRTRACGIAAQQQKMLQQQQQQAKSGGGGLLGGGGLTGSTALPQGAL